MVHLAGLAGMAAWQCLFLIAKKRGAHRGSAIRSQRCLTLSKMTSAKTAQLPKKPRSTPALTPSSCLNTTSYSRSSCCFVCERTGQEEWKKWEEYRRSKLETSTENWKADCPATIFSTDQRERQARCACPRQPRVSGFSTEMTG